MRILVQKFGGSSVADLECMKKVRAKVLAALEEYMPEGVTWTKPNAGMFIWVTLPKDMDATALMSDVLAQNVAYVPGESFYATNPQKNHFRLSFVTVDPDVIKEGVRRLAQVIRLHITK